MFIPTIIFFCILFFYKLYKRHLFLLLLAFNYKFLFLPLFYSIFFFVCVCFCVYLSLLLFCVRLKKYISLPYIYIMHRLSLAALLVLSLSASSSWAAPTSASSIHGGLDTTTNQNIYYTPEQRSNVGKRDIYNIRQQGCINMMDANPNHCHSTSSFVKRQLVVPGQRNMPQQNGAESRPPPNNGGQRQPQLEAQQGLQPQQQPQDHIYMNAQALPSTEQQGHEQPPQQQQEQPAPQQQTAPPQQSQQSYQTPASAPQQQKAPQPQQPAAIHRYVNPASMMSNNHEQDKVIATAPAPAKQEQYVPPSSTTTSPPPGTESPIVTSPPPTKTATETKNPAASEDIITTENSKKKTTTENFKSHNSKVSVPLIDTTVENALSTPSPSTTAKEDKKKKATPTPIEYQDGLTVTLESKSEFCLLLPSDPGNHNIGESEKSARAFCTSEGLAPGAKMMPEGFIQSADFKSTSSYVQVTGTIDNAAYQLSDQDGGGQYDDHGSGSPPGSHCKNYAHYVSLIEPNQNRFCIRW
ncbi:hypothetical protein BDA99DRAFT_44893 [Phascolomyces articulosus]|uniref:Uncharacterized protein n=1 Tax=Phascolomyces articulosus TaxID=60185 RepID=A0AAD5K2E0_9FUNG|nr:hypothetical protein BDA99DRAFT_44893 [Phascolomyces articulosus]